MNDLRNELPLQEQIEIELEIALKAHRGQRDLDGSVTVSSPPHHASHRRSRSPDRSNYFNM